jgi:hypothetical protein
MKVWMIRKKKENVYEYSTGHDAGNVWFRNQFDAKIWTRESQLKAHITRVIHYQNLKVGAYTSDVEVVEYELRVVRVKSIVPKLIGEAL